MDFMYFKLHRIREIIKELRHKYNIIHAIIIKRLYEYDSKYK